MRKSCFLLPRPLLSPAPLSHLGHIFKKASQAYARHQTYGASRLTTSKPTIPAADTNCVLYEPIENVERMEYYRPGGYHPVKIGDHFKDRYRVVHKLGHGTYSTIWLARDEEVDRYVAVKVCTADSKPLEINVLSKLFQPKLLSDIGSSMVPSILDTFSIQGPNGNHVCLVTNPARMSISDAKNGSCIRLFRPEVARVLTAQLAIAVQFIHSQGFVHGDLYHGNVLLRLSRELDQLSTEQLYEQYGEPVYERINRLDGQKLPSRVLRDGVLPLWLGEASEVITLQEARILVPDFGEVFSPVQEQKFESHTPLLIHPPESRFEPTTPLTFSSDI